MSTTRNYSFNKTECILLDGYTASSVLSVSFRTVTVSCHFYTFNTAKVQFHGLLCSI
jgi:hypothetical protein